MCTGHVVDLLTALQQLGCAHTAQQYLLAPAAQHTQHNLQLTDAQYELAWRLANWEDFTPGSASDNQSGGAAVSGSAGMQAGIDNQQGLPFHGSIYKALQVRNHFFFHVVDLALLFIHLLPKHTAMFARTCSVSCLADHTDQIQGGLHEHGWPYNSCSSICQNMIVIM